MSSEPDHEELRILAVAAEVAQKLSIPKFNLKQVKWVSGIQSDRVSFVMRHFKVLLLPLPLKELFLPEEWKPLITSDIMLGRVPDQQDECDRCERSSESQEAPLTASTPS